MGVIIKTFPRFGVYKILIMLHLVEKFLCQNYSEFIMNQKAAARIIVHSLNLVVAI